MKGTRRRNLNGKKRGLGWADAGRSVGTGNRNAPVGRDLKGAAPPRIPVGIAAHGVAGDRLGPRRHERQHWSCTGEGSLQGPTGSWLAAAPPPLRARRPNGRTRTRDAVGTRSKSPATFSGRRGQNRRGKGGVWDGCWSAHGWRTQRGVAIAGSSYQAVGKRCSHQESLPSPGVPGIQRAALAFRFWRTRPPRLGTEVPLSD